MSELVLYGIRQQLPEHPRHRVGPLPWLPTWLVAGLEERKCYLTFFSLNIGAVGRQTATGGKYVVGK